MKNEYTNADSLRMYLTGASSHNGAQADPGESRGRFASSTEATSMGFAMDGSGLIGISVVYAAGENGDGIGVLEAVSGSSIRWTAPGSSTAGEAVTIINGQTKIVEDGENPSAYLRVSRTGTDALTGSVDVLISDEYNNATSHTPVTSAQRTSGLVQYRLIALRNEHESNGLDALDLAAYIQSIPGVSIIDPPGYNASLGASGAGSIEISGASFDGWPAAGWVKVEQVDGSAREVVYYTSRTSTTLTVPAAGRALCETTASAMISSDVLVPWSGIAIAFEDPSAQPNGNFNGDTLNAPSGLSWSTARSSESALNHGTLAHQNQVGLWILWDVPAGAVATPGPPIHLVSINFETLRS